jgi:hypothetical protein
LKKRGREISSNLYPKLKEEFSSLKVIGENRNSLCKRKL